MAYTYRIWDKASPINGCPADKALESLGVRDDELLGILSAGRRDCITQTFPIGTADGVIKAWCDQVNAEATAQQKEAEKHLNDPTIEQRVAALEAAQLDALGV